MPVATRKYNPGFLTDDELVASFCVRTHELDSIIEMLRDCTGSANPHRIVIGPRGSGKTSLLLRAAAEVRRNADLSSRFFPIVFAEDSYEVMSAGEFWLEALSRLSMQAPDPEARDALHRTWQDLRTVLDNRTLGDRCIGALLDFADREDKRILLVVENLNTMFADMSDSVDAGWRLRKILQTDPRFLLIASATSRFDAIDDPEQALYDMFRVITLRPLDVDECAVLWESVSARRRAPDTIRALRILTGGSPRLLAILARFGAELSFRELMADLLDLVDDHTEYFKSHLEALPAQERRVYLALAALWKPATTREIADRARLDTSKCSAHLARLIDRGAVEVTGGTPRRKLYYLTERLYNIYYLMRRASGPDPLIEALVRFMSSYYSSDELKDIGVGIAREAGHLDRAMLSPYQTAFMKLIALPALSPHRAELLRDAPREFVDAIDGRQIQTSDLESARALFSRAFSLGRQNRLEDALAVCDEAVRRFGDSKSSDVLHVVARVPVYRAVLLANLNRFEDALSAYDEAVQRFEDSDTPGVLFWVARGLNGKGATLEKLNRREDALAAYDETVCRFGSSDPSAELYREVIGALVRKGNALAELNRLEDALAAYEEVIRRYRNSPSAPYYELVANALHGKATTLEKLNRFEDVLLTRGEVVRLFETRKAPALLKAVAAALIGNGLLLHVLDRLEEALATWDEVVRRFEGHKDPISLLAVSTAFFGKGETLLELNRPKEAISALDEVIRCLTTSGTSSDLEMIAAAIVERGIALFRLDRPGDALAAWDEVVQRFATSDVPEIRYQVQSALLKRSAVELGQRRYKKSIETAGHAVERHGTMPRDHRWRIYVIRAMAAFESGDRSSCERDIVTVLRLLPDLDTLPIDIISTLRRFSLMLGAQLVRDLIVASPSAELLLPLTTALERELGDEPRVAREIEEVAEDIRSTLSAPVLENWIDSVAGLVSRDSRN